jgi:hypothetical protein
MPKCPKCGCNCGGKGSGKPKPVKTAPKGKPEFFKSKKKQDEISY